jgi:hypothetical protein
MSDSDAAIEQVPDDHPARDVSIVIEDGQPALDFGDGYKLQLRTHVKEWTHENPERGEHVDMKVEVDADDYAWWTLYPERSRNLVFGTDAYPEVVIEPHLIDDSEDGDSSE